MRLRRSSLSPILIVILHHGLLIIFPVATRRECLRFDLVLYLLCPPPLVCTPPVCDSSAIATTLKTLKTTSSHLPSAAGSCGGRFRHSSDHATNPPTLAQPTIRHRAFVFASDCAPPDHAVQININIPNHRYTKWENVSARHGTGKRRINADASLYREIWCHPGRRLVCMCNGSELWWTFVHSNPPLLGDPSPCLPMAQ